MQHSTARDSAVARPSWRAAPIVRRLSALAKLSEAETRVVVQLTARTEAHAAGAEIGAAAAARRPRLIAAGWAARTRTRSDGRRQIVSLLLPGDAFHLDPVESAAQCSVLALTRTDTVDAENLHCLITDGTALGRRLERSLALARQVEQLLLVEQVVRLGQLSAYERIAHLMLELRDRLTAAGLADQHRFLMPLGQDVLADNLGLSVVHVNRTLQQLRRDRLLEVKSRTVLLHDPEALANISGYQSVLGRVLEAVRPEEPQAPGQKTASARH